MKGYRFYLEFESNTKKRRGEHGGNVIAVTLDDRGRPLYNSHAPGREAIVDAITAVYEHPNSGVASTSVQIGFLRTKAKRVSEAVARQVHPTLFLWLDSFKDESEAPASQRGDIQCTKHHNT